MGRISARGLVGVAAVVGTLVLPVGVAHADANSGRKAIVTPGDSYISGEAGRWRGNALDDSGDKWGTDLATRCTGSDCTTDTRWIYTDTDTSGNKCHRSVSAEVVSATSARYIEGYERITGCRFADWPGADQA